MPILPFLAMYFMPRKGFVYTIEADIYTFHYVFSTIPQRILHHFALRLAANSPQMGINDDYYK